MCIRTACDGDTRKITAKNQRAAPELETIVLLEPGWPRTAGVGQTFRALHDRRPGHACIHVAYNVLIGSELASMCVSLVGGST